MNAEEDLRDARREIERLRAAACATCQGRNRKTTDMVCMTCGRDYMPDDGSDETGPGLGWKRLMLAWREQCKQADAELNERCTQYRERADAAEAERDSYIKRAMKAEAKLARVENLITLGLVDDRMAEHIQAALCVGEAPAVGCRERARASE